MFLGESTHSIDGKNRLFVPKRLQHGFAREGEDHHAVILTRGFEGCLFLFSEEGFADVLSRLTTQAFTGAQRRKMQRLFFANAQHGQLDASGRVLLPEKLKQLGGITKEVVMVGCVDRVEIWAKERWESYETANSGAFDELDQVLVEPNQARSLGGSEGPLEPDGLTESNGSAGNGAQ